MNWCKLGLHDWENVGWADYNQFWGKYMKQDAVCMNCGKIKMDAKDYDRKEKEQYLTREARKERARKLFKDAESKK